MCIVISYIAEVHPDSKHVLVKFPHVVQRTEYLLEARKVDAWLPGKGNSNSHGARPVKRIITIMKWIRTHVVQRAEHLRQA